MAAFTVEFVCRTLLVLILIVLDSRCFVVREDNSPDTYFPTEPTPISAPYSIDLQHPPEAETSAIVGGASGADDETIEDEESDRKYSYHKRQHSVTCEYNGKVYPPGEYQISPCVTCVCEKTGELRCISETCPPEPGCIEYEPVPGQCCAQCLQYGCFYNGTGYPRGGSIPTGPCTKCYCPWEGGGGDQTQPVCMDFHCPPVKCVDATVARGHCCPFCPNGENCWLDDLVIPAGQDVWVDKCRSCYCPEGAEAEESVTSNNDVMLSSNTATSSRKFNPTSAESRRRQGYGRRALCYRHSGCIEW